MEPDDLMIGQCMLRRGRCNSRRRITLFLPEFEGSFSPILCLGRGM